MRNFLLTSFFVLTMPLSASAATFTLSATPQDVGAGDLVRVDVLIDSITPVNAFSGIVTYGASLAPISATDGNSIVPLWLTPPAISSAPRIPFEGIVPGGFSGMRGQIFTILFRARAAGKASIAVSEGEVLRNDGKGTPEIVISNPLTFTIAKEARGGYAEPADTTPPEPFSVTMGNDASETAGSLYLVFATTDKGSGVDHYAVAESRVPVFLQRFLPLSFATTESPYVMRDQHRTSAVYIEAVDRAGNVQRAVFPPQYILSWPEVTVLLLILIAVALLFVVVIRRRYSSLP
ncbi:MAG TPA: cohesin domain-containing protein [Candidatus Paceibacterota bacterium]|nr:cohesin domain-containing protein [Candidatus Paceibacterota bacterium]